MVARFCLTPDNWTQGSSCLLKECPPETTKFPAGMALLLGRAFRPRKTHTDPTKGLGWKLSRRCGCPGALWKLGSELGPQMLLGMTVATNTEREEGRAFSWNPLRQGNFLDQTVPGYFLPNQGPLSTKAQAPPTVVRFRT